MTRMAAGLTLALAAGCASSVQTGTGGPGGGAGTGGTGGTVGEPCAAFLDQIGASAVKVRFHNGRVDALPPLVPGTPAGPPGV